MVWYSHLFQNFPQFIVIHTVKGFGIVTLFERKHKCSHNVEGTTILFLKVCLVAQLCLKFQPIGCSMPGSSCHGDSPDQNTGLGYHFLLQGIFPTQGSNPRLPRWKQMLYPLERKSKERVLYVCMSGSNS